MNIKEKNIRAKKWKIFQNKHGYSGLKGGYWFNPDKGYVVKYNGYKTKKYFKKLNSHYNRQRIRSLLNHEQYDLLNNTYEIDPWGWD